MAINDDFLCKAVERAIRDKVVEIVQEEATSAAQRVERRVREKTAEVAATVLEKFQMQRFGDELRISVYFPPTKEV